MSAVAISSESRYGAVHDGECNKYLVNNATQHILTITRKKLLPRICVIIILGKTNRNIL